MVVCDDVFLVNYVGLFFLFWYEWVKRLVFKGIGVVLFFELVGGIEVGKVFVNVLKLYSYVVNIGDVCLLVIYLVLIIYV